MIIDKQIELSIDLEEDFNTVQNFIQNIYLETKKKINFYLQLENMVCYYFKN